MKLALPAVARVNSSNQENQMPKKNKPRTVLVRLVLDNVRGDENGDTLVVVIASNGMRHKIPMHDVVVVEEPENE
jgi:hypothetical protein